MDWLDVDTTDCSVTAACEVVGDRWSILIVRELLNGVRRFDQLLDHLEISPSVLARRLNGLVDHGVLERSRYQEPGARSREEYRLSAAGRDLQPILIALMQWGDRHRIPADRHLVQLTDRSSGTPVELALVDAHGHPVAPGDLVVNVDTARLSRRAG